MTHPPPSLWWLWCLADRHTVDGLLVSYRRCPPVHDSPSPTHFGGFGAWQTGIRSVKVALDAEPPTMPVCQPMTHPPSIQRTLRGIPRHTSVDQVQLVHHCISPCQNSLSSLPVCKPARATAVLARNELLGLIVRCVQCT